jgi:hypothetical protein
MLIKKTQSGDRAHAELGADFIWAPIACLAINFISRSRVWPRNHGLRLGPDRAQVSRALRLRCSRLASKAKRGLVAAHPEKGHIVNDQSASSSPPSSAPAKGAPAAARTRLLLEGPILPTLLRLAAPNVLNLLAFAGMITLDGFFLGRISTDALAGASLAFPWVMLILQTTNSGMGIGVSSAVSRALGAGRRDRANDLVLHAFLLALALAAIFSSVMLAGVPFLFRWMGGRNEMLSDALAYANVALGCPGCPCRSARRLV